MAGSDLLKPFPGLSLVNRGTDFAVVYSRGCRYLTNPALRRNGIPPIDESLEEPLGVRGCTVSGHCVIIMRAGLVRRKATTNGKQKS